MQGSSTRVVTQINGHRDKRSSEMITLKMVKRVNNKLNLFCYLVCAILFFTLFKFERFEDRLSL